MIRLLCETTLRRVVLETFLCAVASAAATALVERLAKRRDDG